jgi:hypothetical protein
LSSSFSADDDKALLDIMDQNPQHYLDEIQILMTRRRGRRWAASTLWDRMHFLGYTLQAAVNRARQRSELKRMQYRVRLGLMSKNPVQLIFIDETHRSSNASRRRRAWGKRGSPVVIDSFFEEDFRKRYTLIAACDLNGFVLSACKIVEREGDKNDRDPDRGTVTMERFEAYVDQCLVPVLGRT